MTSIIAAMQDSLLLIESSKTGWKTHESLKRCHPESVTFDHRNSNRVYCGTLGDGLWKSDDAGHNWDRIAKDSISSNGVTSVSVSRMEQENRVYVGTAPDSILSFEYGLDIIPAMPLVMIFPSFILRKPYLKSFIS